MSIQPTNGAGRILQNPNRVLKEESIRSDEGYTKRVCQLFIEGRCAKTPCDFEHPTRKLYELGKYARVRHHKANTKSAEPTPAPVKLLQRPKKEEAQKQSSDTIQRVVCKFFVNGGCKKNPCKFDHPQSESTKPKDKPKRQTYKDRPVIRPPSNGTAAAAAAVAPLPTPIKVTFINEKRHHIIGHTAVKDKDSAALTDALQNAVNNRFALPDPDSDI